MTEEVIAEGLEAAKTWIRESIELQIELVAKAGSAPAAGLRAPQVDYGDDVAARVAEASGTDAVEQGDDHHRSRPSARRRWPRPRRSILAELAGRVPGREKERSRPPSGRSTKKLVRQRIATEGVRIDGRGTA